MFANSFKILLWKMHPLLMLRIVFTCKAITALTTEKKKLKKQQQNTTTNLVSF